MFGLVLDVPPKNLIFLKLLIQGFYILKYLMNWSIQNQLVIWLVIKLQVTIVSRSSQLSSSEKVTNETGNIGLYTEIPTERYISQGKRQKIINNLRLI